MGSADQPHPNGEATGSLRSGSEALADLYRTMTRIRLCEEAANRLFMQGLVYGTVHLSIGQEAVPAGVCRELGPTDIVTCTYRGHGWAIAKGMPLTRFFGELFARASGACQGRGGSMHLCDTSIGLVGASGIVGGGLPIAVGAGYAAQLRGDRAVAVASFGDGATNIGTFHESLNLAAVWRLPVMFICENNLYGEFTPARETCLLENLADRANAYGINGIVVDGNDVEAVNRVTVDALTQVRAGEGPVLIEAKTYRHKGHSRNDAAAYRPPGEFDAWAQRDPLLIARARLLDAGALDPETLARIDDEIADEIDAAIEFAEGEPSPDPASVSDFVYASAPGPERAS